MKKDKFPNKLYYNIIFIQKNKKLNLIEIKKLKKNKNQVSITVQEKINNKSLLLQIINNKLLDLRLILKNSKFNKLI